MTLNSKDIIKKLEDNKSTLRKYSVKKIGLFGSYAKKTAKKSSDMDFLVVFEHPTFDNYMDLKFFLEKTFRKNVDLVTEDSLKPAIEYVKEEAVYVKAI